MRVLCNGAVGACASGRFCIMFKMHCFDHGFVCPWATSIEPATYVREWVHNRCKGYVKDRFHTPCVNLKTIPQVSPILQRR